MIAREPRQGKFEGQGSTPPGTPSPPRLAKAVGIAPCIKSHQPSGRQVFRCTFNQPTPHHTLSPGLRPGESESRVGELRFHQTHQITERKPSKVRPILNRPVVSALQKQSVNPFVVGVGSVFSVTHCGRYPKHTIFLLEYQRQPNDPYPYPPLPPTLWARNMHGRSALLRNN